MKWASRSTTKSLRIGRKVARNAARASLRSTKWDRASNRFPLKIAPDRARHSGGQACAVALSHAGDKASIPVAVFHVPEYRWFMIRSFKDAATSRLFADEDVPRYRGIERQARRRLLLLDGAGALNDLRQRREIDLKPSRVIVQGNIRSASTINGEFALSGTMAPPNRLRLSTITEEKTHG